MAFKLTPEAQARVNEYREWSAKRKAEFASLRNEDLIATTKVYMANMQPIAWAPGEVVYDATMWHIILPELLERLHRLKDVREMEDCQKCGRKRTG